MVTETILTKDGINTILGRSRVKCSRCNRELKSEASLSRGCGPTCAKKGEIKKVKLKGWFK